MKKLLSFILTGLLAVAFSQTVFAQNGWKLTFDKDTNPMDVLEKKTNLSEENFYFEKGMVRTNANHGVLLQKDSFTTGRVTLTGADGYHSTVELLARCTDSVNAYYSLCVNNSDKKIIFSRFSVNPSKCFRHEFENGGGLSINVSMDFTGKEIIIRSNGIKLGAYPDDGWLTEGRCGIRFGYYSHIYVNSLSCQTLEDIQVAPFKLNEKVPVLPVKDILDWNLDNAWKKENGHRMQVSLNQIWRFQPVEVFGEEPSEDEKDWGYIVIPGYWEKSSTGEYMRNEEGQAIVEWRGLKYQYGRIGAWHKRTFNVQEDWLNKKIELNISDINGKMNVYINGTLVVSKEETAINIIRKDITRYLVAGENEIRLSGTNFENKMAGTGDIMLNIVPRINIGYPGVSSNIKEGRFTLSFMDASSQDETGKLQVEVKDIAGNSVFEESKTFANKMTFDWLPDTLWTPDSPTLYDITCTLFSAEGTVLDSVTIRTGFRNFCVENGQYLLNGKPIILKGNTSLREKAGIWILDYLNNENYMRALFNSYKALNMNFAYLSECPSESVLKMADELGIMLIVRGCMFSHSEMNGHFDRVVKSLDANLANMAKNPVYFAHPSIIGLLEDVWYNYHSGTVNPAYCGNPENDPNLVGNRAKRAEQLNEMYTFYKKYFPDLEVFTGGSSLVGNVYATHIYHTWGAPSAELRAFFEDWAKDPKHPIFVGETELPYIGSFFDLENFRGGGVPYVTEQVSRILGNNGYNYNTSMAPRPFHDHTQNGWRWNRVEPKEGGEYGFKPSGPMTVLETYINEIMPGWRLNGLTGWGTFDYPSNIFCEQELSPECQIFPDDYSAPGMKPEGFNNGNAWRPNEDIRNPDGRYDRRPTALYAPFKRKLANLSLEFFDKEEDQLLQNHSGFGGNVLKKSVVLFNENAYEVEGTLLISIQDNQGGNCELLNKSVKISDRSRAVEYFDIPLPESSSRSEYFVTARFVTEKEKLQDSYAIQVFPRPGKLSFESTVYVFDPENILAPELEKRAKIVKMDSLDTLPEKGVLIIGRGALAKLDSLPDWEKAITNGLNILFMEQPLETSQELMKERTRRTFINAPGHPVFDGLEDADFSYWLDSHSIAPARVITQAGVNWSDWGNRNMVASYVFRRPQHGNYISLLACGFDLFKTPLLEHRSGKGRWIASQLEITERVGTDPVATRVFDNMVRYLSREGMSKTPLFFGGERGRNFLAAFGVDVVSVDTLNPEQLAGHNVLIVSSPDWEQLKLYREELCDFVYWGGSVLYIHDGGLFNPSWLPFTLELESITANRAKVTGEADGFWMNGFGNSEFYWRDSITVPTFSNVPSHFDATSPAVLVRNKFGRGQWILSTLLPSTFDAKAFSAIGKTVRLYSAMFTSLNIPVKGVTTPFENKKSCTFDISEQKWEFATDENDIGVKEEWQNGKGNGIWLSGLIADGIEVRVGQTFERFLRKTYDGVCWYRLTFDLPENVLKCPTLYFSVGAIDDIDEVYLNGVKIGETTENTPNYWKVYRNYPIPEGLLKPMGNRVAVRVTDLREDGGIVQGPVQISDSPLHDGHRIWISPWPDGQNNDYDLKPDIIRMY